MQRLVAACMLVLALLPLAARAADPEIKHVPITTLVRGIPAEIVAEVNAEPGATIVLAEVLVRVTDAGTPVRTPMTASGNSYSATIPLSMIEGVNVFWYSINVRDSQERISSTRWIRVVIVEGADPSKGAAATESGIGKKGWYWAGAALLVGGGAVALENHNDDGNDGGPAPTEPAPAPSNSQDDDKEEPDSPPACQGQGSATILNTTQDCLLGVSAVASGISITVCATCPGGTLLIQTTWGATQTIPDYNNAHCTAPIVLEKPVGIFAVNQHMIRVYLNGNLITQAPYPTNLCPAVD